MNWIGAILLTLCSYIAGTMLASGEKESLFTLEALVSFFCCMRRRIYAERIPLCRIFAEYENELLEKNGFLPLLRSQRAMPSHIWNRAVGLLFIENGVKRELCSFGEALGNLPLDEQIKRIDGCISMLEGARDSVVKTLPEKQKSTKTVCLIIGLITAIILL